ncbi:TPA: hypothetical protein ACGU4V_003743 [Vibrio vulnificus]
MIKPILLFKTTFLKCHLVDFDTTKTKEWCDSYENNYIRFLGQHRSGSRVLECYKPNVSSPVLDCVFSYLSSNRFKKLSTGSKLIYINILRKIFLYLESKDNLSNINTKGFWRDFFDQLSCDTSSTEYNYIVRLLRSSCEQAESYGTQHCKEIRNALKEFPKTVTVDKIPRATLGEKILGKHNSSSQEKKLWRGFSAFLEEAGEILMHHNSSLREHYAAGLPYFIELWERTGKTRSWIDQSTELKDFTLRFISDAFNNKDEKLLVLHKITALEHNESKPSDVCSLFVSKRLNRLVRERYSSASKIDKLRLSIHLLKPTYLLIPALEELVIFKFLLSKWQFTPTMIDSFTPSDITLNPTVNSLQISENKNRSGSNPETTRGHQVIFKKNSHRFEYRFFSYLLEKANLAFEYQGLDPKLDPISKLGVLCSNQSSSIGVFGNPCLLKYDVFSKEAKYFMEAWGEAKSRDKDRFSISGTHISQTQKVMLLDYTIEITTDDDHFGSEDEINEQMESNQRAHNRTTDINIYESRNLSPVLLEADHLVGQQVANLMTNEAKAISGHLKEMSLSDVREFYGLSTESEILSTSDFSEFIDRTGKDVTEYLGIKDEKEIIIVKHPLVLAMMKLYIQYIDVNISELIVDQISSTAMLSDKVIQVEALRIVIASMIENFDEVLHSQADSIINDYDIPSFPPLV